PNPPFIGAGSSYSNTFARTKDGFQLFAASSDTGMKRSLYSLLEESRRVLLHGFTESEFDQQKRQLLSFYDRAFNERGKDESYKYVDEYVNHFLIREPTPGIEWEYDFVKQYLASVKLEDINQLAAKWVTHNNMVITLNAPDKEGVAIPSENEVKNIVSTVEVASVQAYQEKVLAKELMDASKLKPGRIVSSKANEELGTTTLKLSNGVTVILKSTNFKNDEIIVSAFSKGGHSLVKDADYQSAINAASLVAQSGVANFTATDLGNMLKGKNTNVSTSIGLYSESMSGSTTPKEVETLLQLVNLYFTSPRKDKDALESFKTRGKQFYANYLASPFNYYGSEIRKLLTKNHPRAGTTPKPTDFDKISLDRAIQIYKERFGNAGDFTFLFVGSFDEETLKPLLEKYLGSLPATGKKETYKDLGIRPLMGKAEKEIDRGSEEQSLVSIIFNTPAPYNSKDAYSLRSMAEVMDIKLVENLREEKGGVYGVSASANMVRFPYAYSSFNISFPCAPGNIDTLTRAAIDELKKIINNGVSDADLEKIKEQQTRKLEVEMKQNSFWLSGLYESYYYGTDPLDLLNRQKMIDGLTSKMIQAAAKKYINPNSYIRAILKPENSKAPKPLKPF
ncbi:MAG TPA: insulinase family protein, partial [Chitinophagaceae bacterium]|nr:insulinase family protein [Chitinophagaceae bacterium]